MTARPLPDDITIQVVELDATLALRRAVLRPWLSPESARATYVGKGAQFHIAALQAGRVVATAGFEEETQPDYTADFGARQWRLRGMASAPELRGRGLGGQVLEFGIAELARRLNGAGAETAVLWCNGRTGAQSFYERHGFRPIGDLFETPGSGPHYVFWRRVEAA